MPKGYDETYIGRSDLVKEEVDIFIYPEVINTDNNDSFSVGDIHGNTIKLIYYLLKEGLIKNLSQEDYYELVKIYNIDVHKLTIQHLAKLRQIFSSLEFSSKKECIIFGDDIADRGNNDAFTLLLYKRMHESKVRYKILNSNHAMAFVKVIETKGSFGERVPELSGNNWIPNKSNYRSMVNLHECVIKGLLTKEEIVDCFYTGYVPHLVLANIRIKVDEKGKKLIVLQTHAPVENVYSAVFDFYIKYVYPIFKDLRINNKGMDFFELIKSYYANSLSAPEQINLLVKIFQQSNEAHQRYLREGKLHSLMHKIGLPHSLESEVCESCCSEAFLPYVEHTSFRQIIWIQKINNPHPKYGNFNVTHEHGHVGRVYLQPNRLCFDTDLGKRITYSDGTIELNNEGTYLVSRDYYSDKLVLQKAHQELQSTRSLLWLTSFVRSEPLAAENENTSAQMDMKYFCQIN